MQETTDAYALSFSGEFASAAMEAAFLDANWPLIRSMTRCTLLVIAFMGMAFFAADILAGERDATLVLLLAIRLFTTGIIALIALHIGRVPSYEARCRLLLFFVQLLIPIAIFLMAVFRKVPAVYVGVDTILFTLVYYQFVNNQYRLTIAASIFFGLGAIVFSALFLEFKTLELVGAFLFLIPLNYLGITILRSNNRTKRSEYAALQESKRHGVEKEKLIEELQTALAEVKTLRGFIPICSKCKKIRDDKGFWEKIENYIQDRTEAKFSHSLCPNCTTDLYRGFIEKV